ICLDRTTTGDGIISALQVLAAMDRSGRSLHELKSGMKKFPQCMINVRLDRPLDVFNNREIQAAVRDAETALANRGRVLLRPSGTEPVIRVMVEGEDAGEIQALARRLAGVVTRQQGKRAVG
ncbi:MAG TPA: phosphoglucosamine mutase, partial [Chromatiales bacterium]|nr:phosphoglucosamine mutase [Chromatiales bacterium]